MKVGDLVNVHWGNSDWSGEEGVEWGYAPGIVTGEIVWWNDEVEGKHPCGDVEIMFRGRRIDYNIGRLEVINASR
jgi:hypothetical protein|tara:strand:- start:635 stop:859 length:225 start_codon:yes stop_codon:yes gene_type:complete